MKFFKKNWKEIRSNTPGYDASKSSNFRTVVTAALFSLLPLTSCDNNSADNRITLYRNDLYVECVINYQYSGWWSGDPTNTKNIVSFRKKGDIYKWTILEDERLFDNVISFESNDLGVVEEQVSNYLVDNGKLSERTKKSIKKKTKFTSEVLDSTVHKKPLPENKNGNFTIEVR